MSQYSFKLKSLDIRQYAPLSSHFVRFLNAQKDSLEEMILEVREVDSEIINAVYYEMNLKKLFDVHFNRPALEWKINNSIKFLVINNLMRITKDFTLLEQAVNSCQALEMIYMDRIWPRPRRVLAFVSSLLTRLKVVELRLASS